MSSTIPRDVQEFLAGYPDREETDDDSQENLKFYSNARPCMPDNVLIEHIHTKWFGDYEKLENKHGYIQWLFPVQEYGMNWDSSPLQPREIQMMKDSPEIMQRVIRSYRLMLDFFGMRLDSEETGLISRADNYLDRYRNLTRSSHNNLRISRILKCLSELGLERFNAGLILYVLNEQSEHNYLGTAVIKSSMDRWWANIIRNEEERDFVHNTIVSVRIDDDFEFTRELYEEALSRRQETGSFNDSNPLD